MRNGRRLWNLRGLGMLLVLAALVVALVGCASDTPEAVEPEGGGTKEATQDAAQQGAMESPLLPTATAPPAAAEAADLTPAPGLGIVQGVLLLEGEPAAERTMYLAALIASGEGMEVAALDPVEDDRAESDATGTFVFVDVEPGRYALGINSPVGPVLIRAEDGMEILAEVEAGQVVDLGEVWIVPFAE
jgi:hypothetical protein